jgi:hypothetical protein
MVAGEDRSRQRSPDEGRFTDWMAFRPENEREVDALNGRQVRETRQPGVDAAKLRKRLVADQERALELKADREKIRHDLSTNPHDKLVHSVQKAATEEQLRKLRGEE